MTMNDELRALTGSRADAIALSDCAKRTGFLPMRDDAARKIAARLTDETEVFRVLH